MEKVDELIQCPKTGGSLCYKTQAAPNLYIYQSLSSGFWTNSLMKEGEEFYEEQMASLPELYKDIAWKDPETELVWLPITINETHLGMVFPIGNSSANWTWAAVKSTKIPEDEVKDHPHPINEGEYLEYKTDITTMQNFPRDQYVMALEYIGALKNDLEETV